MKNTIGILGTGRMAVRRAKLFAACGHEVNLGSRTPERAARIAQGLASIWKATGRGFSDDAFEKLDQP